MTHPNFPSWSRSYVGRIQAVVLALVLVLAVGPGETCGQSQDSTQVRRFQMADSYVRAGEFEQAIQILEQLYDESPQNISFYRKLKDAYESVKRYDDALRLVENRIDGSPTPALLSDRARLLHLKGNRAAADSTWDRAIALAPKQTRTYRTVYQTLVNIRRFKKAIDVLHRGREALGRTDAFRTELARLYGLDGQHEEAMREYVALLENAPQRAPFVRNRLQTFVEQGEAIEASIRVLETAVQESPLNRAYRELLAWLHMEVNDYAAAFDVYRAIDRLEQQQGRVLFNFGQQAVNAREFDVATRAFSAILDEHPESEVVPAVQRSLGDAYRKWAQANSDSTSTRRDSSRYRKAGEAYETFLRSYPTHDQYPNVLHKLGTLQLDVYRNLERAEETLTQLVENHPKTEAAEEGQFHLARIALVRDSLDRARLLFSRIARGAQQSSLADRAQYELALLHFYRGEFDGAVTRSQAISQNPGTDVANDAINLKVLIQENRGPDSLNAALQVFAEARLYKRQRKYQSALATLDTLLQRHPSHALVDNARFVKANVHLARRDTSAALDSFKSLADRHPQSPYADRSLYRLATLLESQGNDEAARETYNRLLTDYPKSLRASDARSRLRALLRTQG